MKPKKPQALSTATLNLLRPLVRILLRNSVSHRTLTEWAKQAYVEVANVEFGIEGKKQTISRIAIEKSTPRSTLKLICDQHAYMQSWFLPVANPYYATSEKDGRFEIHEVPAGNHTLKV